ncbi:MAG TPA: hypothetical protein VKU82_04155, partial [Planctomycetaceae bacterium]|nr:hypothetical protein [Planctomycetaceae bacterium]
RRCLALAVGDFAKNAFDRISLGAAGDVALWRGYAAEKDAPPPTTKRLRFWLHFVFFPPQYSAATNPRMMQTPPEVRAVKASPEKSLPPN